MEAIIERFNREGFAVYSDPGSGEKPLVGSRIGVKAGRIWYYLGDRIHWGPPIEGSAAVGDYGLRYPTESLSFYACTLDEAPELATGASQDDAARQREETDLQDILDQLGDPPPDHGPAETGNPDDPNA